MNSAVLESIGQGILVRASTILNLNSNALSCIAHNDNHASSFTLDLDVRIMNHPGEMWFGRNEKEQMIGYTRF